MLILRFAEKISPIEVNNGVYVENHYEITKDSPQVFILPGYPSEFNHIYIDEGVKLKPIALVDFLYLHIGFWNYEICVRTDVYPLLWMFYAFIIFLDKQELKLKKFVYKFLLWTKHGEDFLSVGERVSTWREFFKFYLISF